MSIPATELLPGTPDFCNGILWPLFHYLTDRLPLEFPDFELYRAVNERFAEAVEVTNHEFIQHQQAARGNRPNRVGRGRGGARARAWRVYL